MIRTEKLSKTFGDIHALADVDISIGDSSIYGLIGSNGSGKSTILKLLSGAYKQDSGEIYIDGEPVFENTAIKQNIIFLSDDQYFLTNSSISEMADFYRTIYSGFNDRIYNGLCDMFKLDIKRRINTFSKGMQKQAAVLLGLSINPKYLFCDETFDGLDPVVRQLVKKLLTSKMTNEQTTVIIASHSLRELEDICDNVGLIHKGKVLFERELDSLKLGLHNIQCIIKPIDTGYEFVQEDFPALDIISFKRTGSLIRMAVRGELEAIEAEIKAKEPIFYESIPLTLEEIFINEMEAVGYDFTNILE